MACQYFVGGRWVSENEFKALLNEGLLDTLVANDKLNLPGFKKDSAKVKVADKKIIERTTIPAIKLAEILAQEIKTRQGYAPNMLSALELTEDKQNFKIPLWASPYADKFESLLTSLVTNKVVKQKFAGNSYVLGSEEGIKQGDAATGYLKDSAIVFTSKFDATKGLQPLRIDPTTGKMLPAQIMIPFKFRNERGEILSIEEFMTVDEDGRKILDTTKVPEKLLQLFGFRIPTQSRNSMAAVEIVGFLPEAMGDLILAPRDFTKQMGSDFDVDKLYTYMYNHYYQNGKLYTNFLSDPKKIEAQIKIAQESLKDLRESLNLTKEQNKILKDYIKNTVDSNEEKNDIDPVLAQQASEIIAIQDDIKMLIDRISVLNRSYVAAKQNKILDIHLDIMTSTNPDVIASIIALDGSGEFTDLAAEVSKIRSEKGANPVPITILSDIYQRTKYINATAGKDGVGAFSLDSTLNASAQGKDLVYQNLDAETYAEVFGTPMNPRIPTAAELMEANMPVAIFGEFVSKGDMSNPYTLKSQALINKAKAEKRELTKEEKESLKFKSAIIRALQSTAVDNEKEQILDKLNINADTFSAIRAMVIFGFEETDIAGLITQDIIWEYLDRIKSNRSTTSKYNADFQAELMQELTKKYDPENKLEGASESQKLAYEKLGNMSGEQLLENLKGDKFNPTKSTDYNIGQLMILDKFIKLDGIGAEIKKIQSAVNTASKGVPKSLLETNTKVTQIQNLPLSNVFNAGKLLGTIEEGEFTPTTINGYASKYGTMFADQIYSTYFPYNTDGFQKTFKEILKHIPSGDKVFASSTRLADVQNDIFQDIKSYFYSNEGSSLFLGNPDEERARLFIDKEGENKSLATILQELSTQPWYQNNQFLNKLTFNFNSNGDVSRINFESSNAANFDERSIYAGFAYLLSKNVPLVDSEGNDFNGIKYTTRLLAQDLITAAFLEGGIQGSKQYMRYIPIGYLKTLGFGNYLQGIPFDFERTFGGIVDDLGNPIYSMPSSFTRQYIQNNPNLAKTISLGDLKGKVSTVPESFELDKEALERNFVSVVDPVSGDMTETQTHFLTIKDDNKNNKSKYALYEFDESTRKYNRIPVLQGTYGFTQYNSQNAVVVPVYQPKIKDNKPSVVAPGTTIQGVPVKPTKTFDPNIVNNPVQQTPPNQLGVDTNMSGKRALDDLIDRLLSDPTVSTTNRLLLEKLHGLTFPEGFKFEFSKQAGLKGKYSYDNKTLSININHSNHKTANDVANTLAHELIHTFTGDAIRDYQNGNTDNLSAEQINIIDNLKALQLSYINYLDNAGNRNALQTFIDNYNIWAKADPATRQPFADAADRSKYYGAIKLTEFVTMALTDQGFQAWLNKVQVEDKSMMDKLKDLLLQLLNSLGIDIKPGTALASAVKETIDLIDSTQRKEIEGGIFFEPAPGLTSNINISTQTPTAQDEIKVGSMVYSDYGLYKDKTFRVAKMSNVTITKKSKSADRVFKRVRLTLEDGDKVIMIYGTIKNGEFFGTEDATGKTYSSATYVGFKLVPTTSTNILEEQSKLEEAGYRFYKAEDGTYDVEQKEDGIISERVETLEQAIKAAKKDLAGRNAAPTQNKFEYKGKSIDTEFVLTEGQDKALKRLVDFAKSEEKYITLQGAAGTGKTAVIGYLQKYLGTGANFVYMAPTHAATAELAFATVKSGNKKLPMTVQSAFAKIKDRDTGLEAAGPTRKLKDRLGFADNIIVIDEVSMLSAKDYALIKDAIKKQDIKIIFMGDIKQIPEVDVTNPTLKQVSKAFTDNEQVTLTEVKRTESESILSVLTKLRNTQTNLIPRVENTEEIKYLSDVAYNRELVATVKEDPENTLVISYTNKAVEGTNSKIRRLLGREGDPQEGDIIVGYLGYSSKQIEKGDIANSIRYTIDKVEKDGSAYVISASSQKLKQLQELGVQGAVANSRGRYLQLNATDSFNFEDLNSEDYEKNNKEASETFIRLYQAKQAALKNPRKWTDYYAAQNETAKFFANNVLGDDYIYNPNTNKLEKYNSTTHSAIRRSNPELYVEKGIDYGHAVTIHKSQGSTVKNVFFDAISLPKGSSSKLMQGDVQVGSELQSLIYVAMSRASEKLVIDASNPNKFSQGLNMSKITGGTSLSEPFPSNFSDKDDQGPSPEDLDLFNRAFSDESLATREMDEDMYQKYLLICGK
jgi:hypothetical protein